MPLDVLFSRQLGDNRIGTASSGLPSVMVWKVAKAPLPGRRRECPARKKEVEDAPAPFRNEKRDGVMMLQGFGQRKAPAAFAARARMSWWSWRESNPRPQIVQGRFYMLI